MRKSALMAFLFTPLWAVAATNLVSNGSFESGLAGWSLSATPSDGYDVVAISYGSTGTYPGGAFGESIPADNSASISPDLSGAKAAYFVSDFSTQTLTQTITVPTSGFYSIGFSSYAPANGFANVNDAVFTGKIAGVTLVSGNVSAQPVTAWQNFSGTTSLTPGTYQVEFSFLTSAFPAKDLVIDRVYVTAVPVPEPGSLAMMLAGLAGVGFVARRRSQR